MTSFTCNKCGREHTIDPYDMQDINLDNHIGNEILTLSYNCRKCKSNTWIVLKLEWLENKLIGWSIKSSTLIPVRGTNKKISKPKEHSEKKKSILDSPTMWNNKPSEIEDMSPERLLSAIWVGLMKLKISGSARAEIMAQIESVLEENEDNKTE